MLNVNRLRLLREVARRGTLASAARALSYSPSAVSQQLSKLQEEVGVPLFEHVGRSVTLTPQAELLVTHADAILGRIEQAEAEMAAASGKANGRLHVASFQSVALGWLPGVLTLLGRRHPELRIDVTVREPDVARIALLSGDFDLMIDEEYTGDNPPVDERLHKATVADDPIRLVLPAGWSEVEHITDLADAPWTFEPVGSQAYDWCIDYCRSRGLEPDVRFEFDDLMIRMRFIETGHAATLLPQLSARLADQEWVKVVGLADDPSRRIQTVVRAATVGNPAIVAFREAIHEVAHDTEASSREGSQATHWRTPRRAAG